MSPTLYNIVEHFSTKLVLVVVGLLAPFPALAIPIALQDPPAFSEPVTPIPESSHIDHRIIFGIVFVLVLFIIIEIGYAYVGSRTPPIRFIEVINLIYATSATAMQMLSSLRLSRFFEMTADANVDAIPSRE